jgi:hypothetical protein
MPDYTGLFTAFNAAANTRITEKIAIKSIDPVDVGGTFTDFSDLLLGIVNTINEFNITGGTDPPSNLVGNNLDMYFQTGVDFKVYKKYLGVWQLKYTGDLGINIVDGNISLQTSVLDYEVTVSSGNWGIDNTIYGKLTQDQYTVPAPDLNFDRIDGVFADTGNLVNYVPGIAASTPAEPPTPDSSVKISFVYVPSGSSGNLPYVLDSNTPTPNTNVQLQEMTFANTDLVADGDQWKLPIAIPAGKMVAGVIIDYTAAVPTEYMSGGGGYDGYITGFSNNNASAITVKLG